MDTFLDEFPSPMNNFVFEQAPVPAYPNPNLVHEFEANHDFTDPSFFLVNPDPVSDLSSSPGVSSEVDSPDSGDTSNEILRYISQMLMEEEEYLENKPCMLHECLALQAAEKSLHDVLVQEQNPFSTDPLLDSVYRYVESPNPGSNHSSSGSVAAANWVGSDWDCVQDKKPDDNAGIVGVWSMLTQWAQAVASYDTRNADELLKQIRLNSSPSGDGTQRLAHYLADCLELLLVSGVPSYTSLPNSMSAADLLKAYQTYIKACPFHKMSNLYANKTILKLAEKATRLHIIDFGVLYGYQWPCLIKGLSKRPGGPPMLRITGVEFPQPGFRPSERVEQTGRRLENYCKRFNVQFEYTAIANNWETIRYEDIKTDRDELTVVNCLYRLKNLPDETVTDCPRDTVLNLIREINPDLFIHGVVNGSYNAPFFDTRFRETLFHFSSLFDMFEETLPREDQHRLLYEREVYGRDAINVIACEGSRRVERPETYKQWQIRNKRAGFRQLPSDQEILKLVRSMVKRDYHKDFIVDEDGMWVLQGWKGRIVHAISYWKPV
ncbi:hypothetical protein C1H46_043206 [Malus baccata]|uniref:Uncharacterized protein n=1 Tax=Malus baccata TaxID=106549 RepID=A0A540KBE5_MALBA|nr:hypothetical protein C1H46_043206 [Malus baccata]